MDNLNLDDGDGDVVEMESLSRAEPEVMDVLDDDNGDVDEPPKDTGSKASNDGTEERGGKVLISKEEKADEEIVELAYKCQSEEQAPKDSQKKRTKSEVREERCDCLNPSCSGCHLPCKTCQSRLCGHECRYTRTWDYQKVVVEGRGITRTPLDAV